MSLDIKRKQLEMSRVTLGKQELEFKVEEMFSEIERLQGHIKIQEEKIKQLNLEINNKGE